MTVELVPEGTGTQLRLTHTGFSRNGVISDGQHSIRNAVCSVLPDVPHQLCHFHYLREAAKPICFVDWHAKKELKKHIRGVRPIERALEQGKYEQAEPLYKRALSIREQLLGLDHPDTGITINSLANLYREQGKYE